MISLITLFLAIPDSFSFPGALMLQSSHPNFQYWGLGLGQRGQILESPPDELILPEDSPKTAQGISFVLGSPPKTRYALYIPEKDTLYLDTNDNNSLRDEQPLLGEYRMNMRSFGPIRVTVSCNERKTSRYFYVLRYNGEWYLSSADLHQFRVELEGKVREFALIDVNADGTYSSAQPGERRADLFIWLPETLPFDIPSYLPIQEETKPQGQKAIYVYRLDVEPDGSFAHFSPTDLSSGTLAVKEGEASFYLEGNEVGKWNARGDEKGVPQPADRYKIRSYTWTFTQNNEKWELYAYFEKELPALEITKDEVTTWALEKRLTATLEISSLTSPDSYDVSLLLKTPDGGTVGNLTKNGERPPAPKLKVLDKKGRVLLTETFHYG